MAEDFTDALERLYHANTGDIRSWRGLAKRLHDLDDERQTSDNWKRTINRYRQREASPEERTIKLFARAFSVKRAEFPAASPRRQPALEQKRLEGRVATLEDRIDQLEAIVRKVVDE